MLVKKKEKINQLTSEIITNLNTSPDKTLIINKMNEVISIISTISSYSESKSHNSSALYDLTEYLIGTIESLKNEQVSWRRVWINFWCTTVNSVEFKFTEKKAWIKVPPIDLNFIKASISGLKTGLDLK